MRGITMYGYGVGVEVALCFLSKCDLGMEDVSFWLPLSRIGRRDVRIPRGGQEIVRVTLLASLRDDSMVTAARA
jgi:hypothetical protein